MPQAAQQGGNVQTWDYLSLKARWGGAGKVLRACVLNGDKLSDWEDGPRLEDYLQELGEQGWELISEWFDPNTAGGARWQYTWLWAEYDWEKLTVAGRTYKGMQGYVEFITELGNDRWELVSAAPQSLSVIDPDVKYYQNAVTYRGNWLLLLKRPTDESAVTLRFKRPR